MLKNSVQSQTYQHNIRNELEEISHSLKLMQHISVEMATLVEMRENGTERRLLDEKREGLRVEIKQRMRTMERNLNEVLAMLDGKVMILARELAKIQKLHKQTSQPSVSQSKTIAKLQQSYKYQLNQLEERIFQFQKRENEYVKEISSLKEKNAKLREEFSNLSFDSNQRIKELSQKLHNNTSPNLGIKKTGFNGTPVKLQTSYFLTNEDFQKKKINKANNFVKIKTNNTLNNINDGLDSSPTKVKVSSKNMLDSLSLDASDYDIKALGYEVPDYEQTSGTLKFGCFPGKQVSEKTKTGSSSENNKLKFEQNCEKSRRFEFLLNNLMDDPQTDLRSDRVMGGGEQSLVQDRGGNCKYSPLQYQNEPRFELRTVSRTSGQEGVRSVFNENIVKRYQI